MATYPASGTAQSVHKTLTATTVDTINVGGGHTVVLSNRGATNPIYFTTDGSTPTVEGDNTKVCLPNDSRDIRVRSSVGSVKLISAGAQPYSVEVA